MSTPWRTGSVHEQLARGRRTAITALIEARMLRHQLPGELYAWRVQRSSQWRSNAYRLKALRGAHAGQRCFVMGNGPSLMSHDLGLLSSEVTIGSNGHYLIWDQIEWKPTYYTVEDRLTAEDRGSALRDLTGPTFVFALDLAGLLGPPTPTALYVNMPRFYTRFPRFSSDLSRRAYFGGTVSYFSIQLAAYLGCDPIYLIGCDHNYAVPDKTKSGEVLQAGAGGDVNHMHPDYFKPGARWNEPNIARMEASYRCARQHLEEAGVRIRNATTGGHLEVFERVPFDSLF